MCLVVVFVISSYGYSLQWIPDFKSLRHEPQWNHNEAKCMNKYEKSRVLLNRPRREDINACEYDANNVLSIIANPQLLFDSDANNDDKNDNHTEADRY